MDEYKFNNKCGVGTAYAENRWERVNTEADVGRLTNIQEILKLVGQRPTRALGRFP
jgi:hypothetical protein